MKVIYCDGDMAVVSDEAQALDWLADHCEATVTDGALTPDRLTVLADLSVPFSDCPDDVQVDILRDYVTEEVDIESIAREHVLASREGERRRDGPTPGDYCPTESTDYRYEVADALSAVLDTEAFEYGAPEAYQAIEEKLIEDCADRIRDLWSAGYGDIEFEGNRIDREAADEAFGFNDEEDNDEGLDELFG